jgi:amino acid adenylation domain-containing protein
VLQAVGEDATVPISQLPLQSEADRYRQVVEWNATAREYPKDICVHELFAQHATRTPDAIAVVCGQEQLSYRELDERANRIAHHLRQHSVGPETVVGVCMWRSPDMLAALLGVLKAGGAYLPLDPAAPGERRRLMLADTNARALIADSRLDAFARHQLILNDQWLHDAQVPNGPPDIAGRTDSLAYVIYTSGSTGTPKGVMVSHACLMSYLYYACEEYRAEDGEGAPVNTALTFDATITSLWPPLIVGRAITLMPSGPEEIPTLAAALKSGAAYSLLKLTPSHLTALEHYLGPEAQRIAARTFVIGGEALSAAQVPYWQRFAPDTRLINEYGPTETTVGCVVYDIPRDIPQVGGVLIGRPIANTRVYVLDEWLEPVPIGVVGELYIGGAGVAHGYMKRPGLTAERFIADPFGSPGSRFYRSGDLARWRAEGELECFGRTDEQLKIRGFRIEPGEIESKLRAHPQIKDAVVIGRLDERGEKRLVGYFTVKGEAVPGSEELRGHLRRTLPEYMVPAAYVLLGSWPLTPSGKVDRKRLPAPDDRALSAQEYEAPQGEIEEALAQIWRELLDDVQQVGRHDNFFDLGGHSLHATRVIARIRERLGVELPLRALFDDATTVCKQSGKITELYRAQQGVQLPALLPRGEEVRELPLSFMQERLYFLEQLESLGSTYNIGMALRLEGTVDIGVLERSLAELVRRHESLRTRFELRDGQGFQQIDATGQFSLERCEMPDMAGNSRAEGQWLVQEILRPFDLSRGAFRAAMVSAPDHRLFLLIGMHHIVSDGWSLDQVRELSAYAAYLRVSSPSPVRAVRGLRCGSGNGCRARC